MLSSLRRQLGLNRRSRRSVASVSWLCFMLFTLPCVAAPTATCCPESGFSAAAEDTAGEDEGHNGHGTQDRPHHDHGGPVHGGGTDSGHGFASQAVNHDCVEANDCCDTSPPTLEDRSPKPPHKPVDAIATHAVSTTETLASASFLSPSSTGPPRTFREAPPPHLELCRFLI